MSNSIEDIETADVIFQIGGNAHAAHPIIGTFLEGTAKKGAKYIMADPRNVGSAKFADIHMQQNLGTDIALINGMMNHIITNDLHNKEFMEKHTKDFDEFWEVVKEYTPAKASEITGVPVEKITEAAELYAKAPAAAITWGMGIAQRSNAVKTVWALANLALICGQIGRPGTGLNPLRGQNNVQGSGDMALNPGWLPGYQMFNEDYVESLGGKRETATANREKFEKAWGVKLDSKRGISQMEMSDEAGKGKIKCMYLMGSDPIAMAPNMNKSVTDYCNLEFMVTQDLFMTETAKLSDVILPASSNLEMWGTVTNTERRVQLVRPVIDCVGESRPDYEVTLDLMRRFGQEDYLSGQNNKETAQNIMREISLLAPQYAGVNYDKIERLDTKSGGVRWPIAADSDTGTRYLYSNGFAAGKVSLKGQFHSGMHEPPTEEHPLTLVTIRDLYHYDNGHMTKKSPVLSTLEPNGFFEINPETAKEYGLVTGDKAKVVSIRGEAKATIRVTERVQKGQVYSDFHHEDTHINAVTTDALDPLAKEPELKACAVQLIKVSESNSLAEAAVTTEKVHATV